MWAGTEQKKAVRGSEYYALRAYVTRVPTSLLCVTYETAFIVSVQLRKTLKALLTLQVYLLS